MKAYVTTEKRIIVKENGKYGIRNYDEDNMYPQRMRDLAASSGTAVACVNLLSRFIQGDGLADLVFAKQTISDHGLTIDTLNRFIAKSVAYYHGFAFIINYDLNLNPTNIRPVDFSHCRLPDDSNLGKIAVYDNWDKSKKKNIYTEGIRWFHQYTPDKEILRNQIIAAGGIEKFSGHIYYHTYDGSGYQTAPYDSAQEDIAIDAMDKTFRYTVVRKSFAPSAILVTAGNYGDSNVDGNDEVSAEEQRQQLSEQIRQHQGVDNVNSILHFDIENVEDVDKVLKFIPVPQVDNSKMYESIRKATKDNIVEAFGQPSILIGKEVAGKLGTSNEIKDAQDFYNANTVEYRRWIERVYVDVFSKWSTPICPSNDYSILPITLVKQEDAIKAAQAQYRSYVGAITDQRSLTEKVFNGLYPYEPAVQSIIFATGASEQQARNLLGKPTPPPLTNTTIPPAI